MAARLREQTPTLPPEIVFDILNRLPVRSLLKFRCVSKSWCSLISTPSFVISHLQSAEKDSTFTHHRIAFTDLVEPSFDLKQLSLRSVMELPSSSSVDLDTVTVPYPGNHHPGSVSVVGTHNGLICLAIDLRVLLLWNPATRVHSTLPAVRIDPKPGFVRWWTAFGFGYSNATQDYKVLGFFGIFDLNRRTCESVVKMYSHKANSWKTVEGYNNNRVPGSGIFVNGKLHFGMQIQKEIISADLDSDTVGMIEPPDYGDDIYQTCLGVLGDCLCILACSNQQKKNVDVWVLKESWTKLFRIQLEDETSVRRDSMFMLLNGEIWLTLYR